MKTKIVCKFRKEQCTNEIAQIVLLAFDRHGIIIDFIKVDVIEPWWHKFLPWR